MTLITVAHRLQTIMDSDKIVRIILRKLSNDGRLSLSTNSIQMVLDAGRLVEFDTPVNLLKKEGGFLKSLVDQSGDRDALYAMALRRE